MIFYEQPTDPWNQFDFKLLEAYQILNDETCPKCGHPIWICRTSDPDVVFEVRSGLCAADKALEEKRSKRSGNKPSKAEKAEWGRTYFTVPTMNPASGKTELPTRESFYKELSNV